MGAQRDPLEDARGARSAPLPGERSDAELHVVLQPVPGAEGEFVPARWRARTPGAALYEARRIGPDGAWLSDVLLLVPDAGEHTDPADAESNAATAVREAAERRARVALQSPEHPAPGGSDDAEYPPSLFCSLRQRFFAPRCWRTGARLDECRDDRLLDQVGVRRFEESRRRFLYSPRLAQIGDAELELVAEVASAADPPGVLDPAQLIARYGELLRNVERIRRTEPAIAADLDQEFACAGCPEREACYREESAGETAVLARRRLRLFAARRFVPVLLERPALRYDEAQRLFSGCPAEPTTRRSRPVPSATDASWDSLPAGIAQDFVREVGKGGAAWALARKLGLFEALVAEVARVHEACARPVLALRPDQVAVTLEEREPPGARVLLLRLAAGPCEEGADEGAGRPAPWLDPDLLPPDLAGSAAEHALPCTLQIREIRESPSREAGFPYVALELHVRDGLTPGADIIPRDRFQVGFGDGAPPGLQGLSFTASAKEGGDPAARTLVTAPRKVNPEQLRALEAVRRRDLAYCPVAVERACEPAADLYPLGVVYLWTLVGGDAVGLESVAELARRAWHDLRTDSLPDGFAEDPRLAIREYLVEQGYAWALHPGRLVYRGFGVCADDVRPDLWDRVVELGFRMLTRIAGFSLCGSRGDGVAGDPASHARGLLAEVTELRREAEEQPPPERPSADEIRGWIAHWSRGERWVARKARRAK